MIHAYLFIEGGEDDHGPNFQCVMERVNEETGANVTIYHDFHDELALLENRLWQCNGKCRRRSPNFGIVRSETDNFDEFKDEQWFSSHSITCGGKFELVVKS